MELLSDELWLHVSMARWMSCDETGLCLSTEGAQCTARLRLVCRRWDRVIRLQLFPLVNQCDAELHPRISDDATALLYNLSALLLCYWDERLGPHHNTVLSTAGLLQLTRLSSLRFGNHPVIDEALTLPRLAGLRELFLYGNTTVEDSTLRQLTQLESLHLGAKNRITASSLTLLTRLHTLGLRSNAAIPVATETLFALPLLTQLDLSDNLDLQPEALSRLTGLTSLVIQVDSLVDNHVLVTLTQLTHLDISCNNYIGLEAVSQLPLLRELVLESDTNYVIVTEAAEQIAILRERGCIVRHCRRCVCGECSEPPEPVQQQEPNTTGCVVQ